MFNSSGGLGGLKVEAKLASLGRILAHSAPTRSTNNPPRVAGQGSHEAERRNSRIWAPDSTHVRALCNARHAFPTTISGQSVREPARGWRTTLPDAGNLLTRAKGRRKEKHDAHLRKNISPKRCGLSLRAAEVKGQFK